MKRRHLITGEGFPIQVYYKYLANRETVLVCNPLCTKVDLVSPLVDHLLEHFNVVVWEGRGTYLPENLTCITKNNLSVDAHIQDILFLLSALNVQNVDHIVGYSSGGMLATMLQSQQTLSDIKTMTLVATPLDFSGQCKTTYQKTIQPTLMQVYKYGLKQATVISELYGGSTMMQSSGSDKRPTLEEVNREPFKNKYTALMYAYSIMSLYSYNHESAFKHLYQSLFFVQAEDDELVHPDTSSHMNQLSSGSVLKLYPTGGHFLFHNNPASVSDVVAFLQSKSH